MARFLSKDSAIVAFSDSFEFQIVDVRNNLRVKQIVKTPDMGSNYHCTFTLLGDNMFLIGGGRGIIKVFSQQR